jgi:hypothetical protein
VHTIHSTMEPQHHGTTVASQATTDPLKQPSSELELVDRLAEDLVLHEGDGRISRPIKPLGGNISPSAAGRKRNTSGGTSSYFQKIKSINNQYSNSSFPVIDGATEPMAEPPKTNISKESSSLSQNSSSRRPPPRLHTKTMKQFNPEQATATNIRTTVATEEYLSRVRQQSGFVSRENDDEGDSTDYDTDLCSEEEYRHRPQQLTSEDIEICQRLENEYERALEEREIGYNARYASVRQSAFLSIFFMLAYMTQGTFVFMHQANWTIPQSLFFSIFTITTVGYGMEDLPTTPEFQVYTILYIMVGVAALTIVVSIQTKEC